MAGPLTILGFEPYDEGSHRAVRESIAARSRHRWTWFTRPGRGWKWRLRLAAVELVDGPVTLGVNRAPREGFRRGELVDQLTATLPGPLRGDIVFIPPDPRLAAADWDAAPPGDGPFTAAVESLVDRMVPRRSPARRGGGRLGRLVGAR